MTLSPIIEQLAKQCYAMAEDTVPSGLLRDLESDFDKRWENAEFQKAQIGNKEGRKEMASIRGDYTRWWNNSELSPPQIQLLLFLEDLKKEINASLFLGLDSHEVHYALYPVNSFYQKHLDSFRKNNLRKLSLILYFKSKLGIQAWGRVSFVS